MTERNTLALIALILAQIGLAAGILAASTRPTGRAYLAECNQYGMTDYNSLPGWTFPDWNEDIVCKESSDDDED